jgi:hypothetical protein
MFNEEILRIWSVMILLQEISKQSQDGILLYVTLQHYEPNKYILQEKKSLSWETEGQRLHQVTLKPKLLYPYESYICLKNALH